MVKLQFKFSLGGLGSYTLSLMISAFLRMCPPLQTAGETLFEILRYYGYEFCQEKMAIVQGEYVMLMPEQYRIPSNIHNMIGKRLIVWDPFQPGMNAAINVTQFAEIQSCFRQAYSTLHTLKTQFDEQNNKKGVLLEMYNNCRR